MKHRILGALCLAVFLAASPVAALTVDDVMGLTRAGANDAVILAKIDADGTVFRLTVEEILELKAAGVSDTVITYMINTGKLDVSEETQEAPAAEAQSQPVEAEDEAQYDEPSGQYGASGGYNSSVGFGISFGYYYPYWPGYSYAYYYDPFWWPSWPYYYSYWPPYPYYNSYYDPWYACGGDHYHHYYDDWYDHHYNDGYPDPYRVDKGRNVGNRGPVDPVERVIKNPGSPATSRSLSRQTIRLRDSNPDMVATTPTVIRGKVTRPGAPDPQKVSLNPTLRNQVRTQPGKAQVGARPTVRNQVRTQPGKAAVKERPAPRSGANPPQEPTRKEAQSRKDDNSHQDGKARTAPPDRQGYSPGRDRGRSDPSAGSRSGKSQGSSGRGSPPPPPPRSKKG